MYTLKSNENIKKLYSLTSVELCIDLEKKIKINLDQIWNVVFVGKGDRKL